MLRTKTGQVLRVALHPELVTEKLIFRACRDCYTALKNKTVPQYSIRNGYDFGNYERANLPCLLQLVQVMQRMS